MVNAPAHIGQDWKSDVGALKERVIQKINNQLRTNNEVNEDQAAPVRPVSKITFS